MATLRITWILYTMLIYLQVIDTQVVTSLDHVCGNDLSCYLELNETDIQLSCMNYVFENLVVLSTDKFLTSQSSTIDYGPSLSFPNVTCSGVIEIIEINGNGNDLDITGLNFKCPVKVSDVDTFNLDTCSFNSITTDTSTVLNIDQLNSGASITRTNFFGNTINGGTIRGGLVRSSNTNTQISNCKFYDNSVNGAITCDIEGGFIYHRRKAFEMAGCLFHNNTLQASGCLLTRGGIVHLTSDEAVIESSAFIENKIMIIGTDQGCVLYSGADNMEMQTSIIKDNTCTAKDVIYNSAGSLEISTTYTEGNRSPSDSMVYDVGCANALTPTASLISVDGNINSAGCGVTDAGSCGNCDSCGSMFDFDNYLYEHPCVTVSTAAVKPIEYTGCNITSNPESCVECLSGSCKLVDDCSSDVTVVLDVVIDKDVFIEGDFTNNGKVTLISDGNTNLKVTGCAVLGNFIVDVSNIDTSSDRQRISVVECTCVNGTVDIVGADDCSSTTQEQDDSRLYVIIAKNECDSTLAIIIGVVLGSAFLIVLLLLLVIWLVPGLRNKVIPFSLSTRTRNMVQST